MEQKLTRDYPENLLSRLAGDQKICQTISLETSSGLEYLLATTLTSVQRDVIALRYRFKLSCEKSAEMLGCSKQNVHLAENNALEKLRHHPCVKHYLETSEFFLSVDDIPASVQAEILSADADKPLATLGLTVHTYNALRRHGYETVTDILNDWAELHKTPNLGVGGIFELVDIMYEQGYKIPKSVIKASEIKEKRRPNGNKEEQNV